MKFRLKAQALKSIASFRAYFNRRDQSLASYRPEFVKNILIIASTAIGDAVMASPGFREIRKRFSEARIYAYMHRNVLGLFRNNPHIDEIIPYRGGYKRVLFDLAKLRKLDIDLSVILHGNGDVMIPLSYLSGARWVLRTPLCPGYNRFLSNTAEETGPLPANAVVHRLRSLELLGCDINDYHTELFIDDDSTVWVEKYLTARGLTNKRIVGVQIGASSPNRMWGLDRFSVVLGDALTKRDIHVCLIGSKTEKGLREEVWRLLGKHPAVHILDVPIVQLPAMMKRFEVLITPDTGPMHIAQAMGVKTICLMGTDSAAGTAPIFDTEKHIIINKNKVHEDCLGRECKRSECMAQITAGEVISALDIVLKDGKTKS